MAGDLLLCTYVNNIIILFFEILSDEKLEGEPSVVRTNIYSLHYYYLIIK
jgi:hypothetical protein